MKKNPTYKITILYFELFDKDKPFFAAVYDRTKGRSLKERFALLGAATLWEKKHGKMAKNGIYTITATYTKTGLFWFLGKVRCKITPGF